MRAALAAGWSVLVSGGRAVDAVQAAVEVMEDDGAFNAGRGAVKTSAGDQERDAAIMDGDTGASGAVAVLTGERLAVRAARQVADSSRAVLVAGPGAASAPASGGPEAGGAVAGAEQTGTVRGDAGEGPRGADGSSSSEMGTVGAVAIDRDGHLAAATSTGGLAGQRPGRVGDSPIFGAGTWASDNTVAVSATGTGEAFLMAGFAHLIDWQVRGGLDLEAATHAAFVEVERWDGAGGAIVLDHSGRLVTGFDAPWMARGWRGRDTETAEVLNLDESHGAAQPVKTTATRGER